MATVSEDGLVTAHSVGYATIYAHPERGWQVSSCDVEVLPISVKDISLNISSITLDLNGEYQMEATVNPEDAADKTVYWSSSNDDVATVSETGLITTHAVGNAVITAHAGDLTATCQITVMARAVSLDSSSMQMEVSESKQLNAIVYPGTTPQKVVWASANPEVAEVSEDGMVTAIAPGTAFITARCGEGSAFCIVTVKKSSTVSSLTIGIKIERNQTLLLSAIISPADSDEPVVWTSSNPEVAMVTPEGVVEGKAEGTSVITATCGEFTATCIIMIDIASGVSDIEADEEDEVVVFNLQGIKMPANTREELNDLDPGYYIVNDKVELIK